MLKDIAIIRAYEFGAVRVYEVEEYSDRIRLVCEFAWGKAPFIVYNDGRVKVE